MMMEFKVLLLLLVIAAMVIALPLPQDDNGGVDLGLDGTAPGIGGLKRGGKRQGRRSKGGNGRGDETYIGYGADESGLDLDGDVDVGGSDLRLRGSQRGRGGGKRSKNGFRREDDEDPKNNKNSGRGRDAGIGSKRGPGNRD